MGTTVLVKFLGNDKFRRLDIFRKVLKKEFLKMLNSIWTLRICKEYVFTLNPERHFDLPGLWGVRLPFYTFRVGSKCSKILVILKGFFRMEPHVTDTLGAVSITFPCVKHPLNIQGVFRGKGVKRGKQGLGVTLGPIYLPL